MKGGCVLGGDEGGVAVTTEEKTVGLDVVMAESKDKKELKLSIHKKKFSTNFPIFLILFPEFSKSTRSIKRI